MGARSRRKGVVGEREWAAWLREYWGVLAARSAQRHGGPMSPDVVCEANVHWEVKRAERLALEDAIGQAVREAGTERVGVVAHRKNHGEWLLVLRAQDALAFARAVLER